MNACPHPSTRGGVRGWWNASNETKTEPIDEVKPNPKWGACKLSNAPSNIEIDQKRVRTNLINEPLLPEPGSTSSLSSSEAKTEPIVKIKPNPKGGDVQLPNAPLNAENAQKMSENAPYQSWAFLTLILQYLPSPTSKRWLICIGLALYGHSPCAW